MTAAATTRIVLSRRFAAAPERLFSAWLIPSIADRWLFTSPESESNLTHIEPEIGGRWSITDVRAGQDYKAEGEYLEIEPPGRLVFTFGMPQFSAEFARVTVAIEAEADGGSTLTLTQEPVPPGYEDGLAQGWTRMFDQLEAVLAR